MSSTAAVAVQGPQARTWLRRASAAPAGPCPRCPCREVPAHSAHSRNRSISKSLSSQTLAAAPAHAGRIGAARPQAVVAGASPLRGCKLTACLTKRAHHAPLKAHPCQRRAAQPEPAYAYRGPAPHAHDGAGQRGHAPLGPRRGKALELEVGAVVVQACCVWNVSAHMRNGRCAIASIGGYACAVHVIESGAPVGDPADACQARQAFQ